LTLGIEDEPLPLEEQEEVRWTTIEFIKELIGIDFIKKLEFVVSGERMES